MKFICILKIFITIFALIQLCFSTNTDTKLYSSSSVAVGSSASANAKSENKLESKIKITSTTTSKTNLKAKAKTEIKAKTELKSKTGAKSEAKTNLKNTITIKNKNTNKNKNATGRSHIIDVNNLFNPSFNSKATENAKPEQDNKAKGNSADAAGNSEEIKKPNVPKTPEEILSDWLMISSDAFRDKARFPDIFIHQTGEFVKIRVDSMNFRINDAHQKDDEAMNIPSDPNCFWFRLSGLNIYYSSTVSDINILGSISIATVVGLINLENDHSGYFCFIIKDISGIEWKICSLKIEKRNTWVCAIQSTLGVRHENFCNGKTDPTPRVIDHEVKHLINILKIKNFYFYKLH